MGNFVDYIHDHFLRNNIFIKHGYFKENINTNKSSWIIANDIDQQLGHAIFIVLQLCLSQGCPSWSELLHKVSLTLQFWKISESNRTNNLNSDIGINDIRETLPELPLVIPNTSQIKRHIKK